jgi:hypothetical protein
MLQRWNICCWSHPNTVVASCYRLSTCNTVHTSCLHTSYHCKQAVNRDSRAGCVSYESICALQSSVCILYFVALYNIEPEAWPVLSGNSLDSVHRNSYGIVKAVHITLGLYEGAESRKGAAVFNSKQCSYMQQYLFNVTTGAVLRTDRWFVLIVW